MMLIVFLNISRFFKLEPLPQIYVYIDILYLFAGTLAYPLYHIYFRLLTVDEKFSWKAHHRFLILPIIIGIIYFGAVLATPYPEYKVWLFSRDAFANTPGIHLLKILRVVILFAINLQAIYFLVANILLLKKYADRAEQFYSNIQDGKYNHAKLLNYLIIFNCLIHVANAINLFKAPYGVIVSSVLYSIDYYMIAYMGYKQKAINPTFVRELDNPPAQTLGTELNTDLQKLHKKMLVEFEKNRIYLNSELTIIDVVKLVGTNRTYISWMINQQYNQNFCTFVNNYRIEELKRVYLMNPDYTNETLAQSCGFGSLNSMKRAVFSKTGMSIAEWKTQQLLDK
jgi:AraC-like DNA-binding protein